MTNDVRVDEAAKAPPKKAAKKAPPKKAAKKAPPKKAAKKAPPKLSRGARPRIVWRDERGRSAYVDVEPSSRDALEAYLLRADVTPSQLLRGVDDALARHGVHPEDVALARRVALRALARDERSLALLAALAELASPAWSARQLALL